MKKFTLLFYFALLVILSQNSFSQNYTWNGSISSSWAVGTNWTPVAPAGGPGAANNVIINGGTPFSPQLVANVTITNLTMNAGSVLNVGAFVITTVGNTNLTSCTLAGTTGNIQFNGNSNIISALTCNIPFNVNGFWTITNSTFSQPVTMVRSGGNTINSSGGNTYNNTVSIINNSSGAGGHFRYGVTNPDVFNSTVTAEAQTSVAQIHFAYNSAGNSFNGNITVTSIFAGAGPVISFGILGGTTTLNAGVAIVEGGVGFSGGLLDIRNLTQLGNTAQTLDLSWPGALSASALVLNIGPNVIFNGNVNYTASNILVQSTTFNGPTSTGLTKVVNGGSINSWFGANTFNSATTTIMNSTGSSELRMATVSPDVFNSATTIFHRTTNSCIINVAYTGINTFFGDVTVSSSGGLAGTAITFGAGGGTALFTGSNSQIINKPTAAMVPPVFCRLDINKAAQAVTLNSPITVSVNLSLNNGILFTNITKIPTLIPGAVTNIGSPVSYVCGPIICQVASAGTSTLILPVGKNGLHRPALLSVNHTNATITSYTAEVIHSSAMALAYTMPPTLSLVSGVRYWQIDRQAVANFNDAQVTLYYGADDGVADPTNLRVAKTFGAGTTWNDVGGTGSGAPTGSITSVPFTTFSKFTLANNGAIGFNPLGNVVLPIELIDFAAKPENKKVKLIWETATETNNKFFTVERSSDAVNFETVITIEGADNSDHHRNYSVYDNNPLKGISYYRLKQTDHLRGTSYSNLKTVHYTHSGERMILFPNPAESEINLSYLSEKDETIITKVLAFDGRTIAESKMDVKEGSNNLRVNIEELSKGIYTLEVNGDQQTYLKFSKK
ncbi:MAG: hypothetical protein K0S32_207 [Bacteroidetes bacterium]|jgi:hypothetical protein|nr:hypothetical protein [Bacteroidota bacterium]